MKAKLELKQRYWLIELLAWWEGCQSLQQSAAETAKVAAPKLPEQFLLSVNPALTLQCPTKKVTIKPINNGSLKPRDDITLKPKNGITLKPRDEIFDLISHSNNREGGNERCIAEISCFA